VGGVRRDAEIGPCQRVRCGSTTKSAFTVAWSISYPPEYLRRVSVTFPPDPTTATQFTNFSIQTDNHEFDYEQTGSRIEHHSYI